MVQTRFSAFLDYARDLRVEINAALAGYWNGEKGCPERLREAIRHSLLAPCKRLRPLLVLMAAEACGGRREEAMPAACAVEMTHTYSLIHDDLPAMDDDDLRRGRPSCHARYGEATAILAGDALLARAFEVLAAEIRPAAAAAQCCRVLARAAGAAALVGGQADDLAAEFSDRDAAALESIHRRKTGAMFRASLELGARTAGAEAPLRERLARYGERLGLAFQVVDDLLDVSGEEAVLGKRAGKDQGRGKLTFPGLMGVEKSRRRAEELTRSACRELQPLGDRAAALEAVAWYLLERAS